ncbi:ABC transporter ATP-binding protein [Desulfoluna spongiiphila]|uniref:Iron complex transport system ATP-binding protein n=1 Tax=Desulfoluna spongiiphila TaxID=419481 RepID=A0A1G5FHS1_9BACT|nr:ABC transporter ATP-binding protein [Desulfoluna spongiiphila]SCY38835.1 iron complex transport system ATP-binding protein [Desulfoluna spongiiphila]
MTFFVQDLSFGYGSDPVFSGVGFELPPGCVCGVLGVNGAGKSTLLKCLIRILTPSCGEVHLNGRDLRRMPRRQLSRHVAYVPQSSGAQLLSVFDTVLLGRKPYITWAPSRKDLAMVEKILVTMHLDHLALRPAGSLSGGELQKVTIARALAQEPELLLMDEPTSSLDLKNQMAVMDRMSEVVASQGLTAVVSMHDLNLAFRHADYFLLLNNGTMEAFCSRDEVTPEMIRKVYGLPVALERVRGHTVVVPLDSHQATVAMGPSLVKAG